MQKTKKFLKRFVNLNRIKMEKISNIDTQSTKSSKKKLNEGENPEKSI